VEQLSRLLRDPQCRLLTLVGPGGIGKTRLAIEIATQLENDYADGVYFVPFAPVNSPRFVVPLIADSIGFSFQRPVSTNPKTQLLNYLKEKHILLLVDNLEHLLNEQNIIELLAELIQQGPRIKLITTSRESLNLQGEWVFEVRGLPVPENEITEGTSVELFLQRARRAYVRFNATTDDYPAILRICRLVDGTPLGLELAAAWVRTLSCDEIAKAIENSLDFLKASTRDLPERHRSMRAVFDHSWKLLSDEEQSVLSRLSVFQGGFSREAADQIAGATLSTLSILVTKSLIRRSGEGRYDLHELVREYTANRLADQPQIQKEVEACHCAYYLSFFANQDAALRSSAQRKALVQLTVEMGNIRSAWEHAVKHHRAEDLRKAAWTIFHFHELRNRFQEGEQIFLNAEDFYLPAPHDEFDPVSGEITLAYLRTFRACFIVRLGKIAEARQLAEHSLELLRKHNDKAALADSLWINGVMCQFTGKFSEASQYFRETYELVQAISLPWQSTVAPILVGNVEYAMGNFAEAHRWLSEGLTRSRSMGDPVITSFAISSFAANFFAQHAVHAEQIRELDPLLKEGLQLATEVDNRFQTGLLLEQYAYYNTIIGDPTEAEQLCQKSIVCYREISDYWSLSRALTLLGNMELTAGKDEQSQKHFAEALEISHRGNMYANSLNALMGLAYILRKTDPAAALALGIFISQHSSTTHDTKVRAHKLIAETELSLSPQQAEIARTWSRTKSIDDVGREILTGITFQ
jgi:predicted ATPase